MVSCNGALYGKAVKAANMETAPERTLRRMRRGGTAFHDFGECPESRLCLTTRSGETRRDEMISPG